MTGKPCEQCSDNWPNPCGSHDPNLSDLHAIQDQWARQWSQEQRRGMW